ncbi:MAG: serine/threonine-protein kinase [Myxococcota bacterium]|nr:serine/threonine-protein kinase [Myxococcota bacterium]
MSGGPQAADDRARWARRASELLGQVVGGKYRVEKILGRGGMGTIYVAEQQPLGRKVALKVLHSTLGDGGADPEFQKRFLLEAATVAQLSHPNIVVVHDYGGLEHDAAACYMVMELLEGRTISEALQMEGPMPPARALRITREIARALRAAHEQNVIHRDLKPGNVMLVPGPEGEQVKVLDFGLVKVMRDDSEELTAEGRFLGSPRYMSPEQITHSPMDGRSDLYSLGVILYRMLCGDCPYAGDHAVQTLMMHLQQPYPPLATKGAQVPQAVEAIVHRLMQKEAEHRYASAEALVAEIDALWPQLSTDELPRSGEFPMPPPGIRVSEPTPSLTMGAPLPAPAPAKPGVPIWVLGLFGLLAAVAGVAVVLAVVGGTDDPPMEATELPPEPAEPVEAPPEPEPAEPEEVAPATFRLTITSAPSGATVVRDEVELGETPLTLDVARDAEPTEYTVRMRGRRPVTLTQGASEEDVTLEAVLPRAASRPPRRSSRGGGAGASIKTTR